MQQNLKERRRRIEFYRKSEMKMKRDYKEEFKRIAVILSSDYKDILNLMYIFIYNIDYI